jgi:hypothetical protein
MTPKARTILVTAVALLILFGLTVSYSIPDEAYSKRKKHSTDGSNNPLPTENREIGGKPTQKVAVEYTDMPIDSPLFIASHSKHTGKTFGNRQLDLRGEIKNNGTETAHSVKIIATFYNANNVTLGSNIAYTQPDSIEPGQSAPYTINAGSGDGIRVREIDHIKYHIDWQ